MSKLMCPFQIESSNLLPKRLKELNCPIKLRRKRLACEADTEQQLSAAVRLCWTVYRLAWQSGESGIFRRSHSGITANMEKVLLLSIGLFFAWMGCRMIETAAGRSRGLGQPDLLHAQTESERLTCSKESCCQTVFVNFSLNKVVISFQEVWRYPN